MIGDGPCLVDVFDGLGVKNNYGRRRWSRSAWRYQAKLSSSCEHLNPGATTLFRTIQNKTVLQIGMDTSLTTAIDFPRFAGDGNGRCQLSKLNIT